MFTNSTQLECASSVISKQYSCYGSLVSAFYNFKATLFLLGPHGSLPLDLIDVHAQLSSCNALYEG